MVYCFPGSWPRWSRNWHIRQFSNWLNGEQMASLANEMVCYLTPENVRPVSIKDEEDGKNALFHYDWNFGFPKAECYLESCMSQAQAAIYTVALLLQKNCVRFGALKSAHIRSDMFWMLENRRDLDWSFLTMGINSTLIL